jgi:hypothetical protein
MNKTFLILLLENAKYREPRFILRLQAEVSKMFIYRKLKVRTSEGEGKLSNPRAPRARDASRKFTEIYGNPRASAKRAPCIDFLSVIGTVPHLR